MPRLSRILRMTPTPTAPLPLPQRCQVLVVGAGPAGCAAARQLAGQGWDVLLVDQQPLGRDKVCGDALIPDAHHALERLGLLERVMAQAQRSTHVACVGPRGGRIEVPGHLAVLPRRRLDELLNLAAQEAGARFLAPARFEAPLLDEQQQVCGARLLIEGQPHEVQADWVLLATGAVPKALSAAGLCRRHAPSGVALRGYLRAPALAQEFKALDVVWCKPVRPGYGWIFPAPGGVFNIGIGVTDSHKDLAGKGQKKDINLREIFDRFVTHYPPAARLVAQGEWVGELKGAPLRCTLKGADWTRPGLMVIGEAAGSTYSFTGEGIGKAMETGLLAADALAQHGQVDRQARQHYETQLRALQPKYELYERANRVNRYPWLADLLIWRAQRSPRLLHRMSGVLDESSNPGHLISLRGLTRLFIE
jgi:geranylgeranyl reductase family protein